MLMEWKYGHTAYTVHGDLTSGKTPLIILHGGPGFGSKGATAVAGYALSTGRPVVVYDQIGCGDSSALLEKPKEFWQVPIFVEEFNALVNHLRIADNFALIGQSWGGLLAAEIAITQPAGLKALILSSALGDTQTWLDEVRRLVLEMPKEIADVIIKHEEAGTTDSQEYLVAAYKFYDRHVIRIPMPADFAAHFEEAMAQPNVYHSMWGHSELTCTGTLSGHIVTDRLHKIKVPTLVISGKYDESTPKTSRAFIREIPNSHWEIFEESGHCSFLEEAAKYQRVMNDFLQTNT
ncbi:MAG: proline iminopeptidase-family hydrolase [Actinobacteria bacterium]|nr:proline iminopeptidase-family hydrolase [Actinomycetota bacterium]